MPFIEGLASQAVGAGMGMLLGNYNDKRQREQQEDLNRIQIRGQKEMSDYQYAQQMKMWEATNYKAQMEQLTKAGLNPALLYGMSGGGGATTAAGTGAGVQGASAPSGGGEAVAGGAMGMQLALMAAQKANIEADTANKQADTQNKPLQGQQIQASTANLLQGVENAKAQKELTEIQISNAEIENDIKGATQNAAKALIMQELRSSYERMEMIKNEKLISDATVDEKIKLIEQDLIGAYARNELTRAQTGNTQQQTVQSKATVDNMAKQIALAYSQLKNETDKTLLQEKMVKFETSFGKQASNILNTILGARR